MNISVLLDVVKRTDGIVKDNSTYYVYHYLGLGVGDDGISALATNGETTLQAWSTENVNRKVAVQAHVFTEALKTMQGDVRFAFDDNQLIVTSQDAEFRFETTDYDIMPLPQLLQEGSEISGIATLVRMVGSSASKDTARSLDAIYFDGEKAVATDSFRLAVMPFAFPGKALIPIESMRAVARLLGDDPVKVSLSDNQCMFATENMRIWLQLYEPNFLDYKRVLQAVDECDKVMTASTGDVIRSLRRAALFDTYARLDIQNDRLIVHANGEIGSMRDEVDVEADFRVAVRFNVEYLMSLLAAAGSSEVKMRIKDSKSPVGIDDQYGWRAVIMPAILDESNGNDEDEVGEEDEEDEEAPDPVW